MTEIKIGSIKVLVRDEDREALLQQISEVYELAADQLISVSLRNEEDADVLHDIAYDAKCQMRGEI